MMKALMNVRKEFPQPDKFPQSTIDIIFNDEKQSFPLILRTKQGFPFSLACIQDCTAGGSHVLVF